MNQLSITFCYDQYCKIFNNVAGQSWRSPIIHLRTQDLYHSNLRPEVLESFESIRLVQIPPTH